MGEVFQRESGEVLARAAQRDCGRPIPGGVQTKLDAALGSLIQCLIQQLATLLVAGGWDSMILQVPSNTSRSMIL